MSGKVGPGNPPISGRIKKGEVRNPKGRPKKQRQEGPASAFDVVIDKTLTVTRGGEIQEVTMEEALQHRTLQDAMAGNRPARREILKMIAKREKFLARRHKPKWPAAKWSIEPEDPTNAHKAMLLLGIACHHPWFEEINTSYEHVQLEPWAVQAALGRRKGGKRLTEKEIFEINRCTFDSEKIKWPRGTEND